MANSFVLYTGDGAQTDYSVPFAYLDQSHVTVDVDEVEVSFTWLTSNTIRMNVAPANSTSIKVFRTTPTALLVTIPAAGVFRGADINNQTLQAIYLTEESVDALAGVLSEDDSGDFNATTRKIKNLGTPTLDADAATKLYVDATTAADVAAAAASAASAATAQINAETAETAAEAAQTAAEASYDSFDDRYLGAKASAPTLDNDGNALLTGALFFNTATNEMNAYNGSAWQVSYNPSAGTVDSVFGRTGAIVATGGDYNFTHLAGSIAVGQLPSNIVTTVKIADANVTSAKVADEAVTLAKMAHVATARILGRTMASTGDVEALTTAQATALLNAATTTLKGLVERATVAEVRDPSVDSKFPSVKDLYDGAAEVTLTDASTIAVDLDTFINSKVTLAGNRTLGNPTNEVVGKTGFIRVIQDGTGSRTLAFGTDWEFVGKSAPTLTTTASAEDVLFYEVLASNRVLVSAGLDVG